MRFSAKILAATSAVSVASAAAASALILLAAQGVYRRQYEAEYRQKLEMMAGDFTRLEEAYDRIALNAAKVVAEREARTSLNDAKLRQLAGELGVSSISVIDAGGRFIFASERKTSANLFSFCDGYRELVSGDGRPQHTPLLVDGGSPPAVSKFTMIPSRDGHRIIDVSTKFESLSKMLQRVADDESDIVRIVLRSPNGQPLGDVTQSSFSGDPATLLPVRLSVPANAADCCECRIRKLVTGSAPYTYEFVAYVSLVSLDRALAHLYSRFALITAVMLLFALTASFWASRLLVRKVQRIREAVDQASGSGELSLALPVPAVAARHDELDALSAHFNRFFASLQAAQIERIEAKKAEARAAVAAQVAHDIRSPLTSMTLALNQLQQTLRQAGVAEKLSALAHGISRVNGIISRLGKAYRKELPEAVDAVEEPRLTLVDKLFFDVAQEHALRLPATHELRIEGFGAVPGVWAVVQVTELQAALSNLLNNAFEATGPRGQVTLSARVEGRSFQISVRDEGKGIPCELLPRIFERGFTSGKAGGSGLGLSQAKKAIEWSGGKITIDSRSGEGTTVSFTLPVERTPPWCIDQIQLAPGQTLVVADDDTEVLAFWRRQAEVCGIPIRAFETIRELESALPSLAENPVFILDQHAGGGITGLELIEKGQLGGRATLCTFEYDDRLVQEKVKALKIRLIPKPRLRAVTVTLKEGGA